MGVDLPEEADVPAVGIDARDGEAIRRHEIDEVVDDSGVLRILVKRDGDRAR